MKKLMSAKRSATMRPAGFPALCRLLRAFRTLLISSSTSINRSGVAVWSTRSNIKLSRVGTMHPKGRNLIGTLTRPMVESTSLYNSGNVMS
eukprot:2180776-Prymnesium_polylepis.1